jgi:hypothetical protein
MLQNLGLRKSAGMFHRPFINKFGKTWATVAELVTWRLAGSEVSDSASIFAEIEEKILDHETMIIGTDNHHL